MGSKVSSTLPPVVVVGSSGYVGNAVVAALAAKGAKVTAGVRNPDPTASKNARLVAAGVKLVATDMAKPETVTAAISKGATVLIVTPGAENREQLAKNGIAAAVKAGAGHIGLISVTSVEASGLFAEQFRPIEAALTASGVDFSIYRLPPFLDNYLGQPIKDGSAIYQPLSPDRKASQITTHDIGEAIANAFAHLDKVKGRTLTLAGTQSSPTEAAAAFSKALGKKVSYTQVPFEAAKKSALEMGFPEWQATGFVELLKLQEAGDKALVIPDENNHTAELLGRPATTVEQFAEAVKGYLQ